MESHGISKAERSANLVLLFLLLTTSPLALFCFKQFCNTVAFANEHVQLLKTNLMAVYQLLQHYLEQNGPESERSTFQRALISRLWKP